MSGPITNFELGKMRHREYEADASSYWGRHTAGHNSFHRSKKYRWIWALSGGAVTTLLLAQIFVI